MSERTYGQNCGIARAADLLGERWTLLIVRDLLIAPRRFSELERRMKGMGTNLLARRLKDMTQAGLIASGAPRDPYALTAMGLALEPMVLQMVRWSLNWVEVPAGTGGLHFPDWDLLALKALFAPRADLETPILARFEHGDWIAWAKVAPGSYAYGLGEPGTPADVSFPCLITALRNPAAILRQLPPEQQSTAQTFLAAFPLD
ncbi:MAG: helix-turn-helix domain-containing protein [Novosphingobium sp.]|uniref:winged helix-turn-helix transcriptional regulator n=1 Tax=Novosphingobium sp. TaxID=1874826 RepID=UPI0032B80CC1